MMKQNSHSPLNILNHIAIAIFIDLCKAFDTVNYALLISKLPYYGITDIEQKWFKNYLTDRVQYVQYDGKHSQKVEVTCGVPQGSVAGPLLFLLYVNDIFNATSLFTLLYADDTTFIASGPEEGLVNWANKELVKTQMWFQVNKLTLHPKNTRLKVFRNNNLHTWILLH